MNKAKYVTQFNFASFENTDYYLTADYKEFPGIWRINLYFQNDTYDAFNYDRKPSYEDFEKIIENWSKFKANIK